MTDQLPLKFFLGRIEEQDRFREALRAIQRESSAIEKVKDWFAEKEPIALPFIFLLYGAGGMGKTRLAERMRDIALNEDAFKGQFRVIWLDWEKRKELDYCLAAHDSVSPETVYGHICAVFRDEGFGREFDPYKKAVEDRAQTETKVSQAVSRASEGGDRPPAWVKFGSKGLAWLVRSGLVGGVPIPVPQEPTAQVFESIIGGGAVGLAQAREAATPLLRSALTPDEFDLFAFPNEMLARRLADGIRASTAHKPIILTLDTYEIADNADWPWLRMVIKRAGPHVVWVIAGRDNLADSFKHGQAKGYRAEFSSERLRVLPLGEFSVGDVAAYFAGYVPQRPLDARGAEEIHRATRGIPLAVREAAAIWATGVPLEDIVNDVPPLAAHKRIVEAMTERFLWHCLKDSAYPNDRTQLYALALAHRPDPDLLAAMLQSQDLERDLGDLERRHSFVFASEMTLHDDVAAYLHQYLLQPLHRQSVRAVHERAVAHLQDQRQAREKGASTLEVRLADERWTAATLGLAHHSFWRDEDEGWAALMPALVGGLGYDRGFARALVETAEPLQGTFMQAGQRRLKALHSGLSPRPDADAEAALLTELEASARHWPDDGCNAERRAILDLRRGKLLYRRGKYADVLKQYEQAERGLPENGEALRKQLGEALYELAGEFMWPAGRLDAVYSAEAERILLKVVGWLPEKQNAWYRLGVTLRHGGKLAEAIAAYQRAIELDPKDAYLHNGLGNVYRDLGHYEDALAEYQRAIALDPKFDDPHNGLGSVYAELGRTDEAIAEYQRAIELDPTFACYYSNLAGIAIQQVRYRDAIDLSVRALNLKPEHTMHLAHLIIAHLGTNDVIAAKAEAQRGLLSKPKDVVLNLMLWFVYVIDGDQNSITNMLETVTSTGLELPIAEGRTLNILSFKQALREFSQGVKTQASFPEAYLVLSGLSLLAAEAGQALEAFKRIVSIEPNFFENLDAPVPLWRFAEERIAGPLTRVFDSLLASDFRSLVSRFGPVLSAVQSSLGDHYLIEGKCTEAVTAFQRAIELDPKDATSHNGLGNVYAALGRTDEAIAAFQCAIELDPKDATPHNGLGNVYADLGRTDEALAAYQRALAIDSRRFTSRVSLAACYRKLGREIEAAEHIKIAREAMANEVEYNRAYFESVCGNVDEALALLKIALEKKQVSLAWARRDPDFDFIRDDPRFKAVVGAPDQA